MHTDAQIGIGAAAHLRACAALYATRTAQRARPYQRPFLITPLVSESLL